MDVEHFQSDTINSGIKEEIICYLHKEDILSLNFGKSVNYQNKVVNVDPMRKFVVEIVPPDFQNKPDGGRFDDPIDALSEAYKLIETVEEYESNNGMTTKTEGIRTEKIKNTYLHFQSVRQQYR